MPTPAFAVMTSRPAFPYTWTALTSAAANLLYATELVLGNAEGVVVAARLPCRPERRVTGGGDGADHLGVVIDDHRDLPSLRQPPQQLELDGRRRTPIAFGSHDHGMTGDAMLREPTHRAGFEASRAAGEEHDVVLVLKGRDQRQAFRMRGVVLGGIEEAVPITRTAFDEVQPVTHVGEDAVDVDERHRTCRRLVRARRVAHDDPSVGEDHELVGAACDQNSIR